MRKYQRIAVALLIGCAVAALPSIFQPHFKAGSFPDLVCELVLLPGKLIAGLFHNRRYSEPRVSVAVAHSYSYSLRRTGICSFAVYETSLREKVAGTISSPGKSCRLRWSTQHLFGVYSQEG